MMSRVKGSGQLKNKTIIAADADGLKFVNDDMGGHEAGDQLLYYIGRAMEKATAGTSVIPFHVSGDEFYLTGDDAQEVEKAMAMVNELLSRAIIGRKIEYGYQIILEGPELSIGKVTNGDAELADRRTSNDKYRKLAEGRRARREDVPFNVRLLDPDGREFNQQDSRAIIGERRKQREADAAIIDQSDPDNPQALEARLNEYRKAFKGLSLFQTQSERDIRAEYENTPKWMKAPNGKPTNLTERQWVQVRTPEFKAWFGDWEASPEDASKVIDENGEPLVVYHGTDKKFTEFKNKKGNGFWFTPDQDSAMNYASKRTSEEKKMNVYGVFINTRKPSKGQWISPSNPESRTWQDDTVEYHEAGYDGWISRKDDGGVFTVVVMNPAQIKSATGNAGTWDSDNPSILFQTQSERDIRAEYENTPKWMKAPNGKPTNLTERQWVQVRTPEFKAWFGDWELFVEYPKAGEKLGELEVSKSIDNLSSIEASLGDYEILEGVRILPMDTMQRHTADGLFYAKDDHDRVKSLAKKINYNKTITPLIVVLDSEGYYILEGAHRMAALDSLGFKEYPALIVKDLESLEGIDASKVVDENGEPLVVYHGTNSKIDIFDESKTADSVAGRPNTYYDE